MALRALRGEGAWTLFAGLDFHIHLIVHQVVHFPLPPTNPPASISFVLRQTSDLAASVGVKPNV